MPITAAFVDTLRAAFGVEAVNTIIRRGLAGEPGYFWASEGGQVVGTPSSTWNASEDRRS